MYTERYSVCYIRADLFEEIKEIDRSSKRALKHFLSEHTTELLWANLDDRFRYYEDAESFATMVYKKDGSGDVVAIYNWSEKTWMCGWFL